MPIIVWFRRDLRLHDQTALVHACNDSPDGIIPVFIFDDAILKHPDCGANIVEFMLGCIGELKANLQKAGGDLVILHGEPLKELQKLARSTKASAIYLNKDYAPGAVERDEAVALAMKEQGVDVKMFKDQVIFEEQEILTKSKGSPYTIYSQYRKAWETQLAEKGWHTEGPDVLAKPKLKFPPVLKSVKSLDLPTTKSLGFHLTAKSEVPSGESAGRKLLDTFCEKSILQYKHDRNFPALPNGSSRLSAHLRHGTLSPRTCIRQAIAVRNADKLATEGVNTWIGELVWRDFYQQILFNFAHVETRAFKEQWDTLPWRNDEKQWKAWCDGQTGYPIVDAGMRQLNATGWMHNRLRMIVAMFLTKDLLIDYKWGERYFMQHLIDGETAQNNGGWQWSASTGTDAQPYFRIFNPSSQSETCDPDGTFIRHWCPELKHLPTAALHAPWEHEADLIGKVQLGKDYPRPIVDHSTARDTAIGLFRKHREVSI
jgi:deoxyribodipyrimidine photo-lyase